MRIVAKTIFPGFWEQMPMYLFSKMGHNSVSACQPEIYGVC